MLKSFVLVKLAYNAASIALVFKIQFMLKLCSFFRILLLFFFNVMLDKKWIKQ